MLANCWRIYDQWLPFLDSFDAAVHSNWRRYDQGLPFLDSFDGAVHSNASLSDVQKLHYLKGALKDEPFRLLSHLTITNANYSVARELLKDRYADVKMISHAHLEAIFEFTPMKHE